MRRLIACAAVLVTASACRGLAPTSAPPDPPARLVFTPLPDPYTQVTAGPVQAIVPDRWDSVLAGEGGGLHQGLMSSPRLDRWRRLDGSVQGMAAVWLDVARVGVPSDYYYLAASGPVLDSLTSREECRHDQHEILVDHRPDFVGPVDVIASPGDYVARGSGTCIHQGRSTRFAYVIAAPGFGPVRQVGIPNSGLYVVVAVVKSSPQAARELRQMLLSARFGDASVEDLLAAALLSAGQR
jgi:hypothetical protein